MEYQINIEYTIKGQTKHLSYKFENAEVRNQTYRIICAEFSNDEVEMNFLRNNDAITLTTYNYSEPVQGEIAQIVPHSHFRIEVLDKVLEMVKLKAI